MINHYDYYMIINNTFYLSEKDKELFYKLHLDKVPNTGIYRKNWNYFKDHINYSLNTR